jgi:hypothetical protein
MTSNGPSQFRIGLESVSRGATVRRKLLTVDPFAVVILGGLVALIIWLVLLGKYVPGSGLDQLGFKSASQIHESREALDAEDLAQMLEARNARRRARGEPELTIEDLELQVMQDVNELRRRREEYLADRDLDELLAATNARRRARGLPERTREEVEREFGSGPPGASRVRD